MSRQHSGRKPREQALDDQLNRRCPCGKVYAPSKAAAKRLHKHAVRTHPGPAAPVRFYECEYASWHWTHRTPARTPDDPSRSTP